MRVRIGVKIFSIAVGLLILMGTAALISLRMTKTVDDQLKILDGNYFPAYVAMVQGNVHSLKESMYVRRLVIAFSETPRDGDKIAKLRTEIADNAKTSDSDLAEARVLINRQIADPIDFNDNVELARLDTRLEFLEGDREHYA